MLGSLAIPNSILVISYLKGIIWNLKYHSELFGAKVDLDGKFSINTVNDFVNDFLNKYS